MVRSLNGLELHEFNLPNAVIEHEIAVAGKLAKISEISLLDLSSSSKSSIMTSDSDTNSRNDSNPSPVST